MGADIRGAGTDVIKINGVENCNRPGIPTCTCLHLPRRAPIK